MLGLRPREARHCLSTLYPESRGARVSVSQSSLHSLFWGRSRRKWLQSRVVSGGAHLCLDHLAGSSWSHSQLLILVSVILPFCLLPWTCLQEVKKQRDCVFWVHLLFSSFLNDKQFIFFNRTISWVSAGTKHLLSAYCVPGTVLRPGDREPRKDTSGPSLGSYSPARGDEHWSKALIVCEGETTPNVFPTLLVPPPVALALIWQAGHIVWAPGFLTPFLWRCWISSDPGCQRNAAGLCRLTLVSYLCTGSSGKSLPFTPTCLLCQRSLSPFVIFAADQESPGL